MMSSTAFGPLTTPRGVAFRSPFPPPRRARRSRGGLAHMAEGGVPSYAQYMTSAAPLGLEPDQYRDDYERYLAEVVGARSRARMRPEHAYSFKKRRAMDVGSPGLKSMASFFLGEQPAEWALSSDILTAGKIHPLVGGLSALLYSGEAGEPDVRKTVMEEFGKDPHELRRAAFEHLFRKQYGRAPVQSDLVRNSLLGPEELSYRQPFTP